MATNKLLITCVVLLAGCSANRYVFPDKAIIDVPFVTEAIQIEKELDARSDAIAPEETPWFEVIEGPVPIIVTAPHATKPLREGKYRFSDGGGTAALAKMLNKLTGVTVVHTTFASPSDPNYYDDNTFKVALKKLISQRQPVLILDIHGSHGYRPYDVDLGTMDGKSLLGNEEIAANLIDTFRKEGLMNISYNYFGASKNQTITKFGSILGVPSVQLEISSTWLTPSQSELSAHRFAQILQAMVKFIESEKRKISNTSVSKIGLQAAGARISPDP